MKITINTIAKNNLRRKVFRSIAIAGAVMVVAATLFSVTTVMDSVELSLTKSIQRLGADIMVVPKGSEVKAKASLLSGEPTEFYMDNTIEDKVRKVKGVRHTAAQLYLLTSKYKCCDVGDMLMIGFDPKNDFTIMPWLTQSLKRDIKDDEAIMGRAITAFQVGASLTAYGRIFKVVGMIEQTGMKFIDNSMFLPMEGVRKAIEESKRTGNKAVDIPENKISTVLVQVTPDLSPSRVAIFIEYEIHGVTAIVSEEVISTVRKQLFMLLKSVLSVSILLWVMALFLIGLVFSMIVNERQREIGLLRAMGAKKTDVFKLIMTEASMLSLSGGLAGIVLGGTFLFLFKDFIKSSLNIPYLWPDTLHFAMLIAFSLILSLLTGAIAAFYPALWSMKMEPYAAIRKGE
ncbi:ABC transporter permease [Candidatus Magnetomonas plexicatena]|uniref:ABC transporter permease n=1 Tax=Candidatus Magnetomonas plexicatena TaxID=2552947 RepID=UPI001C779E04|nr:FtsX-like permease family protein [Nitrospirales bacterium LBB_01]